MATQTLKQVKTADLELKERFEKDNKLEDFDKNVIFLNSNLEFF